MNENRIKIRFMVFVTMLCSIQIVLMLTPLGFIMIGPGLKVTTQHIPVILAGILLGVKAGAIVGFVFGMCSVIRSTLTPAITSFVFTPFYSLGDYQGNGWSLVIAIGPRVLLGVLSALIYKSSGSLLTAMICTLIHSFSVLGLIYSFFGSAFASANEIGESSLITFLLGIMFTNGLIETVVAAFLVTVLVKVLEPTIKKVM